MERAINLIMRSKLNIFKKQIMYVEEPIDDVCDIPIDECVGLTYNSQRWCTRAYC